MIITKKKEKLEVGAQWDNTTREVVKMQPTAF